MVRDQRAAVAERNDAVRCIERDDGDGTWTADTLFAVHRDLERSLDHVPDLFVRMMVFVDRRTFGEVPVRERHRRRVIDAPLPTGTTLPGFDRIGVDERHRGSLPTRELMVAAVAITGLGEVGSAH